MCRQVLDALVADAEEAITAEYECYTTLLAVEQHQLHKQARRVAKSVIADRAKAMRKSESASRRHARDSSDNSHR